MERLYAILSENGTSVNEKHEAWSLPKGGQLGVWMRPVKGPLTATHGYHLSRAGDLVSRLGAAIYRAEYRGDRLDTESDVVVREARLVCRLESWNDETARDFAAACADRVLPIFEAQRPQDDRPRRAIEAARLFALGEVTAEELAAVWARARDVMTAELRAVAVDALAAARAAAMSAAVGSGWSVAGAAEDTARAAREAAAWAATRATARDTWGASDPVERRMLRGSMAEAWASADAAERAWQTERLLAYLAAARIGHEDQELEGRPALAS